MGPRHCKIAAARYGHVGMQVLRFGIFRSCVYKQFQTDEIQVLKPVWLLHINEVDTQFRVEFAILMRVKI
jgi:hypothetical protein